MKKDKRGIIVTSHPSRLATGASNAWRHPEVGGFTSVGLQSVGTLDAAIVQSTRQLQDIRSLQASNPVKIGSLIMRSNE